MNPSIFVQMASYRDPELQPTLANLIDQADQPERLRIVVCWQHAPDETLDAFASAGFEIGPTLASSGTDPVHLLTYRGASLELIDIHHLASRGACWARNQIQQRYRGERYTLQLDSHHRFVRAWDQQAIDMLEALRESSPKPLLTTYLPEYCPDTPPQALAHTPTGMRFCRFTAEGTVLVNRAVIHGWERVERPLRSRFYSAHFAFADGDFAREVQHDPSLFFYGEEISLAVRAFTHGYDLFHPHRTLAWHRYDRSGRVKIWDDHSPGARKAGAIPTDWIERNTQSLARQRKLLGVDGEAESAETFGLHGLGTARTLREYEAFAGIDFSLRAIQRETAENRPPHPAIPAHAADDAWRRTLKRSHELRIRQPLPALGDLSDIEMCHLSARTDAGHELYRWLLDITILQRDMSDDWLDMKFFFLSALDQHPAEYVIELLGTDARLRTRIACPVPTRDAST